MDIVQDALEKMGVPWEEVSVLQDKDGVVVARVVSQAHSFVIKCFRGEDFRREIANYRMLAGLDVPTLPVAAATDSAILLEDIASSPLFRLGREHDMDDPAVAKGLARWYRRLHQRGYAYTALHGAEMYDESDFFTLENIRRIQEKTGTQGEADWRLLDVHFDAICRALRRVRRTITYNDFYYTNMIVAKDLSSAFMFDYNLMGKGYAYADVRNVTSVLSTHSKEAFLTEYGPWDALEAAVDAVVSPVVTLYLACQRQPFPSWAASSLEALRTDFCADVERLVDWAGDCTL